MESNNNEDNTENGQVLAEDELAREVSDHMLVLWSVHTAVHQGKANIGSFVLYNKQLFSNMIQGESG